MGTRLRTAYQTGPKSMAPIGGRPFLEYVITKIRSGGIGEVVLCVGYKRSHIQRHFRKGTKWGVQLHYSIERELLGTGGAIRKAGGLLSSEAVFAFNGDSFIDLDLRHMWESHHDRNALATIALAPIEGPNRYGRVVLSNSDKIVRFHEKQECPFGSDEESDWINAGAYLFSREFLDLIPPDRPISLEKEIFPRLVDAGLYGYKTKGYFIDIGVPDDFARATRELPARWRV